jgi:hypothetical protein
LVFEKDEPLNYNRNVHFGFRCGERDSVVSWAKKSNASLEQDEVHYAFKSGDPEGNVFEVYKEAEE